MKRQNLKVLSACAGIMCATLCLNACGANAGNNPNTFILENPASGKTQEQEIAETDIVVSDTNSDITVTIKAPDDVELTTEDGTLYYTITCSYPVVFINGNEAAAEKINADILSRVDAFNTGVNIQAETAKEDFEYMLGDGVQPPMPYSSDLSFTVTRADDNVIAFTENSYEYMGGAHGMPGTTGINYNTKTGELITFTELSDNPDAFRADTLAYNQALAQTEYYNMQLFNTDDITNGTLEQVLYADGMWYLSTSGLVFMSPPYALAPYSSGTLEFTIPYGDLKGMGFKEAYTYTADNL